jgi:cyclin B
VGVSALLIACKYEEIYPPDIKDFVFICDKAYTKEDVLQMEFLILSTLSFDVSFPTSLRFLERFLRVLGDTPDVKYLSQFLMELAMIDVRMIKHPNSVLAASALCCAYQMITRTDESVRIEGQILERLQISQSQLNVVRFCCKELHYIVERSKNSSLQAVRKKYRGPVFSAVHPYIYSE